MTWSMNVCLLTIHSFTEGKSNGPVFKIAETSFETISADVKKNIFEEKQEQSVLCS